MKAEKWLEICLVLKTQRNQENGTKEEFEGFNKLYISKTLAFEWYKNFKEGQEGSIDFFCADF